MEPNLAFTREATLHRPPNSTEHLTNGDRFSGYIAPCSRGCVNGVGLFELPMLYMMQSSLRPTYHDNTIHISNGTYYLPHLFLTCRIMSTHPRPVGLKPRSFAYLFQSATTAADAGPVDNHARASGLGRCST